MRILAPTVLFLLAVMSVSVATAQDAVRVRGGEHSGYGRIVFDWQQDVQYRVAVEGNRLRVEFGRRASFQTGQLFPALDDYIGEAAEGPHGYRITFPLKGDFGVEASRYGSKVIIDLQNSEPDEPTLAKVRVRAGPHPDFDRIVFDWPEVVDYAVRNDRAKGRVRITFGRPAQFDVSDYRNAQLSRVLALTPFPGDEEVDVELDVEPGARVRDFKLDNRVVVDVFEPGEAPAQVASRNDSAEDEETAPSASGMSANAGSDKTSVANGGMDTQEAGAEDAGGTSGTTKTRDGGDGSSQPDGGRKSSADEGPGAPTPLTPDAATDESAAGRSSKSGAASVGAPSIREPDTSAETASDESSSDPQQAAAVRPPSAQAPESSDRLTTRIAYTPEQVAQGLAPKAGEVPRTVTPTRIDLPWAGATAAVFRRAGSLFLVANGAPPTTFARQLVDAADGVKKVEQSLKGSMSVVRMHTAPEMGARLVRDGDLWKLSLRPRAALPARPIRINVEEGRMLLPTDDAGRVVRLKDPGSGGPMDVATIGGRGMGVTLEKRFQEFALLPTTQGVAVLPLAEHVRTKVTDAGVVIEGEGRKLAISRTDLNRNAGGARDSLDGNRLLKLAEWRRPNQSYNDARQKLQQAVAEAPAAKKHLARLDLARFYFAHGLAKETLGALNLYSKETPRRESDPQVQLMMGASHLLAGDWDDAGKALAHPALDGVKAALPWRAAQAMSTGNDRAALAAFERSKAMLKPYPASVKKQLRMWAAEAYLRVGNIPKAEQQLETLRGMDLTTGEKVEVKYLTGRRLLLNSQVDEAEQVWREVSKGDHAPTRARARFVMIERDLAAERISRDEAIQKLERLRFAWRGDEFEAVLLNRLADLYLAGNEYRAGLETLEQAASHLPNTAQAQQAADRMRDVFTRLFLDGAADKMSPIKALALYEDFRELTPPGEEGNRLIAKLADRLVQVDLLSRAASLLDGQVRHRLSGEPKAQSGARLASIYMLDRAPSKALEALNISRQDNLPAKLRRKRRYLRARSLLKAGRHAEALTAISGDDRPEALRIRAKTHADAGNWSKAADNLAALLPDKPKDGESLSKPEIASVMRQAVALTLADDQEGLRRLDRRYGDGFAGSKQAATFDMLTEGDSSDPTKVGAQLAQVQRAKSFVDGFLSSLRQQASLE